MSYFFFMGFELFCAILSLNLEAIYAGDGFVPRHNLPAGRLLPNGFLRASDVARLGNPGLQDISESKMAKDVAPAPSNQMSSQNQRGLSDRSLIQSSAPISRQQEPNDDQIMKLISSQQALPARAPVAAPQQQQQQPVQIVYVPVLVPIHTPPEPAAPPPPAPASAPAPTPAPASANLPSWLANPNSGRLPWNG